MDKIDYIPYIRKKIGSDLCLSVGLAALIFDKDGKVLIEQRSDNGKYCIPGGSIDLNETVIDGVKREVYEETGLEISDLTLFAIFSGEKTNFHYPNGDVTQYVDLYFFAHHYDGVLKKEDEESTKIYFCSLDDLPKQEEWLPNSYRALVEYRNGRKELLID